MGTETAALSGSDWDCPLTDDDLRQIDAAVSAAPAPVASPIKECTAESCASVATPANSGRRLPESMFAFRGQQSGSPLTPSPLLRKRSYIERNRLDRSPFRELKFGGRVVYSRTVEEVERAAQALLKFVEANKEKDGLCVLGLDIEWRPTFRRGVAPGKVSVMQICGENNLCHVLHIIHSQVPKSLQHLLEDSSSLKVGVCIENDATKLLQDHNVSVQNLRDLSDLATIKLGGHPKKWSLSMLTEMLICRQLPKPSKIRLGNWEVEVLSKEQLSYAATDAYISWYLYQVLKNLPDPTDDGDTQASAAPK